MATGQELATESGEIHDAEALHADVAAMTRQLFGGPVTITKEFDPELPVYYFVVSVHASGEVHEIVALNQRWHVALGEAVGESADAYRLSLEVS